MSLMPDDTIVFVAADAKKNLRMVGTAKRGIAPARISGLLGAHGVSPMGWRIEATVTLPRNKKVVADVRRKLFARAGEKHPVYIDNRNSLLGEAWGVLVIHDMTRPEADALVAAVRADLKQRLATEAMAQT